MRYSKINFIMIDFIYNITNGDHLGKTTPFGKKKMSLKSIVSSYSGLYTAVKSPTVQYSQVGL